MGKVKLKSRGVPRKSFQDSGSINPQDAGRDFGGLVHNPPCYVVCPSSNEGISSLVKAANATAKLTIAARGNGHSIHGQAQALNGIVIDMAKMPSNAIRVYDRRRHRPKLEEDDQERGEEEGGDGGRDAGSFVEASGGALWIDVLRETLKHGLAPASWTDYLYLTVGGTLSNAGVSGQAFRHGPQISNAIQLQVVTGKGDTVTCSASRNSELFFAVLGGLGQFGIITQARIALEDAPERARYSRFLYADFDAFQKDLEWLISLRLEDELAVNYVEGIVIPATNDPHQGYNSVPFHGEAIDPSLLPEAADRSVLYCIEVAKYYKQQQELLVDHHLERLLGSLSFLPSLVFSTDLAYFDFLNRVRGVEEVLRKMKRWEVPHPWLALFVPRSKISKFNEIVFREIVCKGVNGPMLVYPLNRSKWETKSSVVVPDESIFYIVCLLRYVVADSGQPLEVHVQQNAEIMRRCEINNLGVKQYFPHYHTEIEWKQHFGDSWGKFLANKLKYDPNAVLAPGQRIFSKNKMVNRV